MLKGTLEDFIRDTKTKLVGSVNFKDLQDLKEHIQDKVGIEDFRKIVDDKADRLSTIEA